MVTPASAAVGVISDIDDTVVISDTSHLLRMARLVFLSNARSRLPFPGVAALYRALHRGMGSQTDNPIFYVSSSPWNLYDLLSDFFALQDIPAGPLFLREWSGAAQAGLPLGLKFDPPFPLPIGRPVNAFLNVCSNARNFSTDSVTDG